MAVISTCAFLDRAHTGRWSYTEHGFVTAFIADRTQLSSHALNVVVHYFEGIIAALAGVLFLTCWGTPPWVKNC